MSRLKYYEWISTLNPDFQCTYIFFINSLKNEIDFLFIWLLLVILLVSLLFEIFIMQFLLLFYLFFMNMLLQIVNFAVKTFNNEILFSNWNLIYSFFNCITSVLYLQWFSTNVFGKRSRTMSVTFLWSFCMEWFIFTCWFGCFIW